MHGKVIYEVRGIVKISLRIYKSENKSIIQSTVFY